MNRIARYSSYNEECSFAYFSPDNLSLLVGGSDGVSKILYINDCGQVVDTYQLKNHEGSANYGEFSPNGRKVVTCSSDKTFSIYSADNTLNIVGRFQHHQFGVRWCTFSPDSSMVCTTGWDSKAVISCSSTGKLLCSLIGHHKPLTAAQFSQPGILVTAAWDKAIRVWDTQYKTSFPLTGHSDVVWSVAFNPVQPHILASISRDKTLSIWDIRMGGRIKALKDDINELVYIKYSDDGSKIFGVGENSTFITRDTASVQRILYKTTSGHTGRINHFSMSYNGNILATAGADGYVSIWDINPHSRSDIDNLAAAFGMATVMDS